MFRLHTSNDAARLADTLGDWLRAPAANPLEPSRALVPQQGLARWLQVYLAATRGVIANVEFTPPARFIWELLRAADPQLPPDSPYEVERLRWHIYALLGEPLTGKALRPLHAYLAAEGDPLRRFALSLALARVYERMQGYRRDKLLAWERGADAGDWQAALWRAIVARVGGTSRAARVQAWLARFDPEHGGSATPPGLPARFACFACANISPDVLRMLAVAGRHCDVDFLLPLPSMEFLGDIPQTRAAVRERLGERNDENPLIMSLGGALSEFVNLLFDYQHVQPDVEHDAYDADIARATLLGRVRDDILHHAAPRAADQAAQPDASLQFLACHTPMREVEALHDALLALFDADHSLQPRDIAVMLPDVAAYRPAIEAVFGGVPRDDARFLPFNLGDLGAAAQHPAAELFLQLLDAPTSRWEADELTGVLAVPGVQRRFDLDADAARQLAQRVRVAGVRWGEDRAARKDCGEYAEYSWQFGIDRIAAGFACGDTDALPGGTAPLAGVEGAAFGQLDALLGVTAVWRELRTLAHGDAQSAREWQAQLNRVFDALYAADPDDNGETRAVERIRAALARLADDSAAAGDDLRLPWPDVRAFLRDALAAPDPAERLFGGGITFCGMVPLRVVPFRVICLLGMDAGAFPRREANGLDPLLADRRAGHPERGDRDVRADDRLLFLQLLAAARDAFYVSWIGRDVHTNKDLPPSAVVGELLDLVRTQYLAPPADEAARKVRDAILPRREPLHPFDRRLFGGDGAAPRSYQAQWLPAANTHALRKDPLAPFVAAALPEPATDASTATITLDDLRQFYRDPARGFLERGVGLRLPHDAEDDANLEPLQPDAPLLRYHLTRALLKNSDDEAAAARLAAEAHLPPGQFGAAALAIARARASTLREAGADFSGGAAPLPDLIGEVTLADGTAISGSVGDRYAAGLLRMHPGEVNGKVILRAFIDQLFASVVTGRTVPCRVLGVKKHDGAPSVECVNLQALEPEAAKRKLAELVAMLRAGLRAPLPLVPNASWAALKRTRQSKGPADLGEFIDNFCKAAAGDDAYSAGNEFSAAAFGIAWRGVDFAKLDATTGKRFFDTANALLPTLATPAKAARAKP